MHFRFFAVFGAAVLVLSACSPTIYKSNDFEASRSQVHTMAILPFFVTIQQRPNEAKKTTAQDLEDYQDRTGLTMQSSAYSWLLQRSKDYTVEFQDVDRTNALLSSNGITAATLVMQDKGELCKLLGVDAVMSGKVQMSKPMSDGAAVAVGVLFGAWGATSNTMTSLTVHGAESKLLWKYDWQASGSVGSDAKSLTNGLLRNASKHYPYKK